MSRICTILLALVPLGACASTGARPEPFPRPQGSRPIETAPASQRPVIPPTVDGSIAGTALGLRGVPYRNGGHDPSGFDCSGFVWYVFSRHGIALPRTVGELYGRSVPVPSTSVAAGDLVFFDTSGRGVSHVGISLGGDQFVHAPSSSGEVRTERIVGSYWTPRFVGARRVQ